MIENETQYRVAQERERTFSQLVERLESGEAQGIPGEDPAISRAKLDASRSVLQELREEIQEWESNPPDNGRTEYVTLLLDHDTINWFKAQTGEDEDTEGTKWTTLAERALQEHARREAKV